MEKVKIRTFKDLEAWKQAHVLAVEVYRLTKKFPREEMFGIVNQMRRAAVSVTSNLAEGFSRQSLKEKIQFYSIAQGSLTELQSQLLISQDVGFLYLKDYDSIEPQTIHTHKLISGLLRSTKSLNLNS